MSDYKEERKKAQERYRKALRAARKKAESEGASFAFPQPRYDEVYREGMRWLEEQCSGIGDQTLIVANPPEPGSAFAEALAQIDQVAKPSKLPVWVDQVPEFQEEFAEIERRSRRLSAAYRASFRDPDFEKNIEGLKGADLDAYLKPFEDPNYCPVWDRISKMSDQELEEDRKRRGLPDLETACQLFRQAVAKAVAKARAERAKLGLTDDDPL